MLGVFEEAYPEDNRPREAIEAVETYLSNPTEENRLACKTCALAATYAAAVAAIDSIDYETAYAAASATLSTPNKKELYEYGLKLLLGEENELKRSS